MYKYITRT